ncbi:MAG: ABC transporter ATP-binding protein [Candidatus Bathyarchaeia archaeon]
MLTLDNVHAEYGEVEVLSGISLKVDEGQLVALIGPNGHGKSTVIKTVSGLLKPTDGEIIFDGEKVGGLPPDKIVEKGIVHVPEGSRLFPYMTVKENLLLGAYPKSSWKTREKNLKSVYRLFPILEQRKKQLASSLSGGERQMVALGRGLMCNVKLLMMDEPSMGLAPVVADELYSKIGEVRKTGVSILIVEQNVKRIANSDRIFLIENGVVRLQGTSKEVLESDYLKHAYLGKT